MFLPRMFCKCRFSNTQRVPLHRFPVPEAKGVFLWASVLPDLLHPSKSPLPPWQQHKALLTALGVLQQELAPSIVTFPTNCANPTLYWETCTIEMGLPVSPQRSWCLPLLTKPEFDKYLSKPLSILLYICIHTHIRERTFIQRYNRSIPITLWSGSAFFSFSHNQHNFILTFWKPR